MSYSNHYENPSITSENELRKIISPYPKMLDKRIVPELDQYCLEIIQHAALVVFASSRDDSDINIFARSDIDIVDAKTIKIKQLKVAQLSKRHLYASLYFLVPGIGHGLRVNGRLSFEQSDLTIQIDGAYVHCARAAARSELWKTNEFKILANNSLSETPEAFLKSSAFLLLKTMNTDTQTEISPRGDQAGFVQLLSDQRVFIPERPGNKVAVSLRNIIQNPNIELLMLKPGSNLCLRINGAARVTSESKYLEPSTVNGKTPKLGILIEDCQFEILKNDALEYAWNHQSYLPSDQITKFSKVLSAHMNGEGLLGKATTPVIQAVVNHDMKNLY